NARAPRPDDLHILRRTQRDPAAIHVAGALARPHRFRCFAGRGHLHLPGRGFTVVHRDPGIRLLRDLRHRLHGRLVDRLGNAHGRPGLSPAGPANSRWGAVVTEPQEAEVVSRERAALVRAVTPWQRIKGVIVYCLRTPMLVAGVLLLLALFAIGWVGPLFVDTGLADPTSAPPDLPPSRDYPLGTDDQGRNLLAVAVVGLPLTLRVGLIAGA